MHTSKFVIPSMKEQLLLEQRLEKALTKSFEKYFSLGGQGVRKIDLYAIFKKALREGVLAYSEDNFELAASLLNSSVGYIESVKYLEQAGLRLKAEKDNKKKITEKKIYGRVS